MPIKDEAELEDFMVEIDILSECKHKHVVDMFQAYVHNNELWVNIYIVSFLSFLRSNFFAFLVVKDRLITISPRNGYSK